MFAVPGLITREWRRTVKKALNLRPEHLSFYSLEIAEGTVFDRMISDGVPAGDSGGNGQAHVRGVLRRSMQSRIQSL